MKFEESHIQRACVRWFALQYPELKGILFAVPNGGGRSKIEAGILKAEGVTAGVSVVCCPDRLAKVERGRKFPKCSWQDYEDEPLKND